MPIFIGAASGTFMRKTARRLARAAFPTALVTAAVLAGPAPVAAAGTTTAAVTATPIAASPATAAQAAAAPCDPGGNKIVCENSKPGSPRDEWDRSSFQATLEIEGFATDMSVNVGGTIDFKIRTSATSYRIDIYRMGYYGGDGARKITTINPSVSLPQTQPSCVSDETTGLVDCGNWAVSASWTVPSTAVSGVYFARMERTDDVEGDNHIMFVVRDDSSNSDLFFQTADTTWQAYNDWGGNSTYVGNSSAAPGRGVKVSYNRPFTSRDATDGGRDFVFSQEYPMIRWLESNGYDISYTSGIDTERRGQLLQNHAVFLSVGHDEYWSGRQRLNVEAARDAGVNLAFFSGNEVFWKTRWENSVAGPATPYRTLVVYKETRAYADIDPSDEWTGTWRDPRFSAPLDANRPENSLTGQIFTVNCCSYAMKVPAADGKMRFWRNTSIADQSPGETATLPEGVLGFEWDEDLDNGSRPAGLFRMSSTTATDVFQKLTDFGAFYGPGEATHHLTMYRAPSGALVFGAGTVRWMWGLDDQHDDQGGAVDVRMQQATVNLLADMDAQPDTLQPGLVAATKSADATPPVSTITSPAAGANLHNGSTVTISGTATDSGGGRVGGVEVSTDGGATWHPAEGRESWSYTWSAVGGGDMPIKTRAVDDSGNLETPGAGRTFTVTCPCGLFGNAATPTITSAATTVKHELGVKFTPDVNGWITGVQFYKGAGNTGTHTGTLWTSTGTKLATGTFTGETSSGWQTLMFPAPVQVSGGTTYVASYFAPNGGFAADEGWFQQKPMLSPPLTSPRNVTGNGNGVYLRSAAGFPTSTYEGSNYWVDVIFETTEPPDMIAPAVIGRTPYPGSTSVPPTVKPSLTFTEPIVAGSFTFTLKDAANNTVPGSAALDATGTVLTFTPASALAGSTKYTVTVTGARDAAGNIAPVETFELTTAKPTPPPGTCPCSIWPDSATPAVATAEDSQAVVLGVTFRADENGQIDGIRFYKGPGNGGTHVGNLWAADGTKLAEATFTGESVAGWQEVTFANPVPVTAGTTYVASYHAPNGGYSYNWGQLGGAGVDNPPLHALRHAGNDKNGVFKYGANAFPDTGSTANYWVDVVFSRGPDVSAPVAAAADPLAGETSVPTGTNVAVRFNEPVQENTIQLTLTGPGGADVPGSVAYDSATRTATFTPSSALAAGTAYTAFVSGAKDAADNTMSPYAYTFTTAKAAAAGCPCSIWPDSARPAVRTADDANAVVLGVKFRADENGQIRGVRFYKGPGNGGTHVGNLWAADGTKLAEATFTGESSAGWQEVVFDTPVNVTAGTTYIASYHAPNGRYSYNWAQFGPGGVDNPPLHALGYGVDGPNGIYRYGGNAFPDSGSTANYWVDVIFTPAS
jgi:hypothetical protein